jgi:Holliday junction resolvase RusA-like endonuclease
MKQLFVSFFIPGEPVGKGRARSTMSGHHYTPEKTRQYEETVGYIALQAMAGKQPLAEACRIELVVLCGIPKSASILVHKKMLEGVIRPTKKPDTDNALKCVKDAINRIVYTDDCLVVEDEVKKFYSDTPGTTAYIYTWRSNND